MSLIFKRTETITVDTDWELPPTDGRKIRALAMHVIVSAPGALVGDTLDVYLQTRDQTGVWIDRAHSSQYLGNGAAQDQLYTVVSWPPLSQTEESGTPPGPTTGARLDADSVRHGLFPGIYRELKVNPGAEAGYKQPGASIRISLDRGGTASPGFPITVELDADYNTDYD